MFIRVSFFRLALVGRPAKLAFGGNIATGCGVGSSGCATTGCTAHAWLAHHPMHNPAERPVILGAMKKLLAAARAAKATVVYSIIANTTTADVIKDVAPEASEPHVQAGPDKFLHTDLEKILKDKGIKMVIAVGTASNGSRALHRKRCSVPRHERDHPGGRHVFGGSDRRIRDRARFPDRAVSVDQNDSDAERYDQVLSLSSPGRRVAT
jgi:hypothetical protein